MEAKRNLKFCRVCLVPEDNENFKSIFEENGKIATKIFNISSTIAVDVFDDCPAVICSSCLREVEESDALRQRILDANDHYQSLSASREAEMFKANLLELKKIINNKENADCQEQPQNNNNELKKFFVPNVYLNRQIKNEPESLLMAHLLKKSQPSTVKPTKSVLPMISQKHVQPFFKVSPTRPTRSVVPKTPPKETPTKVKTRRRESILSMKIKRLMSDVNTKSPVKKKVPELKAKAQPVIRALLKPQTKPDQTQRLVKILLKPVIKEQTSESAQRKQVEEQTKVERRLGGKTTSEVMQSRSIEGNKRRTKMFTLPCRRKRDPGVKIVTCFECDTCKRTFKSSLELNSHIESHERKFNLLQNFDLLLTISLSSSFR